MKAFLGRAAIALSLLLLASVPRAATVGAEYANWDTNGDPYLPNTGSNATDFVNYMSFFGHPAKFLLGNTNFWTGDTVDPQVTGYWDTTYSDNVNIYFFSTHGGSNPGYFIMSPGHDNTVDGVTSTLSYTTYPYTSPPHNWWRLGNKDCRILSMVSCHSMELAHISHWDSVADGIHMITGGDGLMYDNPGRGATYALWGNLFGTTVKQAWFMASPDPRERPVVMAYGINSADAQSRLNGETFHSSMARLGPRTYRWWAWVR